MFFFQLQHPDTVGWVEKHAVGATMLNLNTTILSSVPIRLPTLEIQKRIADILSAYDSFFKLLENETVYYNDFKTIQKEKIDFLLSQGTIRIDEAGEIELKYDRLRMLIQLYRYEYLCLAYEKTENDPLKDALKNNKLLVENTLFSRPEQDYLDYLLNKHKFSNGLDLRNKYIHSTNSLDEKVHRDDYMRFLIVMAIIIIKINEEFCLKEKLKK